ncbi:MAG: hypothetical protein IPO63_00955 [Bacteroidetes bacterium]|nr:hypothetical protein [Bacteroidota bacterium]
MINFLQKRICNIKLVSVSFFLTLGVSLAPAQSTVIGNVFSIVSDPEPENELLSFQAKSYVASIECKWSGNFSASVRNFELQRAAKSVDFVTIATIDRNKFCGATNTFCFEDKNVKDKIKYFYRLQYSTNDGLVVHSTIISAKVNSNSIVIAEASPNPYKDRTTIQYMLSNPSLVTLEISNEIGEVVKRFQQGLQKEGRYAVPFSAKEAGLPSGNYNVTVWFDDESYQLSITETE